MSATAVSTGPARAPEAVVSPLRPMPLWQSVLFFGIPALLFAFSLWVVKPFLTGLGVDPYVSFTLPVGALSALVLVASLVAHRLEGNPLTWQAVRERFRLHRMDRRAWLWTAGLFLFSFAAVGVVGPLTEALVAALGLSFPEAVPEQTNVPAFLLYLPFNIIGEELWWRGYILPRQELTHGRWAWAVHGTLWTLFHSAMAVEMPMLFLPALGLSLMAQRLKNTTPCIVWHTAINLATSLASVVG